MKRNMGPADRIIRIIIAAIVIALVLTNVIPGVWGIVFLAIAGVLVLTSFVGFCPLYTLFGIHTNTEHGVQ